MVIYAQHLTLCFLTAFSIVFLTCDSVEEPLVSARSAFQGIISAKMPPSSSGGLYQDSGMKKSSTLLIIYILYQPFSFRGKHMHSRKIIDICRHMILRETKKPISTDWGPFFESISSALCAAKIDLSQAHRAKWSINTIFRNLQTP